MRKSSILLAAACVSGLCAVAAPQAKADPYDRTQAWREQQLREFRWHERQRELRRDYGDGWHQPPPVYATPVVPYYAPPPPVYYPPVYQAPTYVTPGASFGFYFR